MGRMNRIIFLRMTFCAVCSCHVRHHSLRFIPSRTRLVADASTASSNPSCTSLGRPRALAFLRASQLRIRAYFASLGRPHARRAWESSAAWLDIVPGDVSGTRFPDSDALTGGDAGPALRRSMGCIVFIYTGVGSAVCVESSSLVRSDSRWVGGTASGIAPNFVPEPQLRTRYSCRLLSLQSTDFGVFGLLHRLPWGRGR